MCLVAAVCACGCMAADQTAASPSMSESSGSAFTDGSINGTYNRGVRRYGDRGRHNLDASRRKREPLASALLPLLN